MAKKQENNGVIRDFDLKKDSIRVLYYAILLIGFFMAFVGFAPLIWLIFSGFKDIREFVLEPTILPKAFDFNNYLVTWNQLNFVKYYRNSFIVVVGSIASAIFFNGLLAYVISKVKPMGSQVILALVMWSLLIPNTTSIVPLFVNISRLHLTGSFVPLWLAIGANAFFVVLFKGFFDDIPESLIEAAKLDGAKDFTIFIRIVIPLSQAIMIVIILYAVNAAWSDFLLPYLTLRNSEFETVMVRLFQFRNGRYNDVQIIRGAIFSLIPPIILFFLFQKQITQISMRSGVK
jgi:multiple sugar transport system permease protein